MLSDKIVRIWRLRRKNDDPGGATALADRPPAEREYGSAAELRAEIANLTQANRSRPERDTERQLLALRHHAGLRQLELVNADPQHPSPDFAPLPEVEGLPEIAAADLTPELLRAGILRDGSLLVRGLIDRDRALRFAAQIERSFAERERLLAGQVPAEGYYEEFQPAAPHEVEEGLRGWVSAGGGVLAVDSPLLAFEMMEMFEAAGVLALAERYLGEPALISLQKTTLRKAEPSVTGAWHQDGFFLGPVRALNLWLSLSRCGDEAPGLDIVPRRLDQLVTTQTEEAILGYQVSQSKAEQAAADTPIIRPIFEPGDALLFDELCLHQTGSDPSMPKPRFAIENWFFAGSAFPREYAPIAAS